MRSAKIVTVMVSANEKASSATFVIERASERDIKIRGLKVLLDGNYLTDLSYGDKTEFQVPEGKHVLKVTNSLYSKQVEFEAVQGQVNRFNAGNVVRGLGAVMFVAMGVGPYSVFLEKQEAA